MLSRMATYTAKQARALATFFRSFPAAPAAYVYDDGSLHEEPKPGASLAYCIPRGSSLRYSAAGDWASETNFLDKLDEEDFTWELASRGVFETSVLFPTVRDRL